MNIDEPQADFELMAMLREWRQERARRDGVPLYVVLPNRLLTDIVRSRPTSEDEMRLLKGMGPQRFERYGAEILKMIGPATDCIDVAQRAGILSDVPLAGVHLPYRVVIEYHLDDAARRQLVTELTGPPGPIARDLQAALRAGPAAVSIRIEAERAA